MKKMLSALVLGLLVVGCQPKTETVVIQGEKGERGEVGPRGESGAAGLSAYELAVKNGFVGTEVQWLQSLIGATGAAGKDGNNGKSAYELWLEIPGNKSKTLTEFIESLKGSNGTDGQSCTVSKTGSAATVMCGTGGSVVINDGVNGTNGQNGISPTITVTNQTTCQYGGIAVNGVVACFDGSAVTVTSNVSVISLCGAEYGIKVGNDLYAVYHQEMCEKGHGNGESPCTSTNPNSKYSNTYLAKLAAGAVYRATDGSGCTFTVNSNGTVTK